MAVICHLRRPRTLLCHLHLATPDFLNQKRVPCMFMDVPLPNPHCRCHALAPCIISYSVEFVDSFFLHCIFLRCTNSFIPPGSYITGPTFYFLSYTLIIYLYRTLQSRLRRYTCSMRPLGSVCHRIIISNDHRTFLDLTIINHHDYRFVYSFFTPALCDTIAVYASSGISSPASGFRLSFSFNFFSLGL
jgi:hypothetical protein